MPGIQTALPHLALLIEAALQGLHARPDLRQSPGHRLVVGGVGLNDLAGLLIHHGLTQEVHKVQRLVNLPAAAAALTPTTH